MKKEEMDLSFIKENDLDKTGAFEDLMTRSERKKYLEEKKQIEDKTVEFQTADLMEHISEEKKVLEETDKKEKKKKKKDKKKVEEEPVKDDIEEIIEEKVEIKEETKEEKPVINIKPEEKKEIIEQLKELTDEDDELVKEDVSVANNVILSIFNILIIAYYIYINYINKEFSDLYRLIIDIGILVTSFNYAIAMITRKKVHVVFSVFTYLFMIAYIVFNALVFFKVI